MKARWVVLLAGVAVLCLLGAAWAGGFRPNSTGPAPNSDLRTSLTLVDLQTIGLGKKPSGGVYDTANRAVYISASGSNNVTVINTYTNAHLSVAVGKDPRGIVYDPYNRNLYVLNYNSSSLSIISGSSNKVTATVTLAKGAKPENAIFDPATGGVFVLNTTGSSSTAAWLVANTTNKVTSIQLSAGGDFSLVYSPTTKEIYLPSAGSSVLAVSSSGSVKTIPVTFSPVLVSYSPASKDVLVSGVDLKKKGEPAELGVISSADKVTKTILDATVNELVLPVEYLSTQIGAGYDPINHDLYFPAYNITSNKSYVVVLSSSNAILATVLLGKGAPISSGYYFPEAQEMFFGSLSSTNGVYVLNGTKLVTQIKTGQPVYYFTYDPSFALMFAAGTPNTGASVLYAFDSTNSVVGSLTVGKEAVAFLYAPQDTSVFVVNIGSNDVERVN